MFCFLNRVLGAFGSLSLLSNSQLVEVTGGGCSSTNEELALQIRGFLGSMEICSMFKCPFDRNGVRLYFNFCRDL